MFYGHALAAELPPVNVRSYTAAFDCTAKHMAPANIANCSFCFFMFLMFCFPNMHSSKTSGFACPVRD